MTDDYRRKAIDPKATTLCGARRGQRTSLAGPSGADIARWFAADREDNVGFGKDPESGPSWMRGSGRLRGMWLGQRNGSPPCPIDQLDQRARRRQEEQENTQPSSVLGC
jgi:hypothetical protein